MGLLDQATRFGRWMAVFVVGTGTPAIAVADGLGGTPLCEASAVESLPCPDAVDRTCWIVADNEVRDRLFAFDRRPDEGPAVETRRSFVVPRISDMEALARTGAGDLLVYGSHSRNKRCRLRANRRVFERLHVAGGGFVSRARVESPEIDWREAFGVRPEGVLARVAAVVERGEAAADAGDCTRRLDIEAAAVVPGPGGADTVWIGLRTPLVDGHAVLLRHDVDAGLRFVDARLVDLGGAGIRGLDARDGRLYGLSALAGAGADDETGAFSLWRFATTALSADEPIRVERLAEVPAKSEGLAVAGSRVLVVQDGDEGEPECEQESRYTVVPLP